MSKIKANKILRKNIIDLTNKKFNRLFVLGIAEKPKHLKGRGSFWECKCDCGKIVYVRGNALKSNKTKSCGCYNIESFIKRNTTHNLHNTSEHNSWAQMKDRCLNINNVNFKYYGGRGITVCDKWKNSFITFYNDMGPKPSKDHSLDRIDNNKGYSKNNCRWATKLEQVQNRNSIKYITYNKMTLNLKDWSRFITKNKNTSLVYGRVYNGWSNIEAVSTPYIPRKK